eukprot:TRINITY_DN41700_c0_g1_i1.p1 TRINITY_DN41700_c0_g1~~TRINITY_DN41700_c0_g1_i1.p1  ORF type:complete len:437 (+),score=175.06 TRINITY_DN41700_c0_g1_i1:43-1353(+)
MSNTPIAKRAKMVKPVLGILCGGGPAPGMNCVISSATIEAINQGWDVIGFYDGFKWLVEGRTDKIGYLNISGYTSEGGVKVSRIHNRGGTVLRTSRVNPTRNPVHLTNTVEALKKLNVKYLVTIGGDDTATSASKVAEAAEHAFAVAHVPKTIDNDLPLPRGIPTFGYETARHYGVEIIRNLMNDSKSTARWYLVVAMGRAAGHLALGIGKAAGATLTIIPEEFAGKEVNFSSICDVIESSIIKRRALGKEYGVCILAEGLTEYMTDEEVERLAGNMGVERDEHGHVRLDEIELGGAVKDEIKRRFAKREQKVTLIAKNLGYELRSADPTPFDIAYTRDLGFGAVQYLKNGGSKAMITMRGETLTPVPFTEFCDATTGRAKTRIVDVSAEGYRVARAYMIRLSARDNEPEKLECLAAAGNMTVEQFKAQFGHLLLE